MVGGTRGSGGGTRAPTKKWGWAPIKCLTQKYCIYLITTFLDKENYMKTSALFGFPPNPTPPHQKCLCSIATVNDWIKVKKEGKKDQRN